MSMQIIDWKEFLSRPVKSAITIGVFDGLHLGHMELLRRIIKRGPNPTVITFRENPRKRIAGDTFEGEIFSLGQKLTAFENLGLDRIVLIDFSEEFCKIKGRDFIDLLEESGKMAYLAIGDDFRCGYMQDTGADTIREINEGKGIPTEIVSPLSLAGGPVSSSRIRSAIISGDLKLAAILMGRNLELDLSGLKPVRLKSGGFQSGGLSYDLREVQRVIPAQGSYPVLLYPAGKKAASKEVAFFEDGKIFLPEKAESIEFI